MAMSLPRLDRFLAHALQISRTDAQRLVRAGRVDIALAAPAPASETEEATAEAIVVNRAKDPSAHVPADASVLVDDRPVSLPGQIVLMLHKPPGVVSATRDTRDRTVIDIVPTKLRLRDLSPVGRLDKDATGLLLLTNDGALLHRLTHPKRHVPRTYALTWDGMLPDDAVARVAAGIALEDDTVCMPAELVITGSNTGSMTVHQGMYHQVKRMIVALGAVVTTLHRTQYGPLTLGDLAQGETRALTKEELLSIGA